MILPLLYYIILPVVTSLLFFIVSKNKTKYIALFVQIFMLIEIVARLFYQGGAVHIEALSTHVFPIAMKLRWDSFSGIMLLLGGILFPLAHLYGIRRKHVENLYTFLFLSLQGFINGVFLSADFFNVYLFIEISSIIVSMLIMYKKDAIALYDGMLYLMVNLVAMVFFIFGVGYMYKIFGTFDMIVIEGLIVELKDPGILILPFAFLITGAALKSALMPLFSWLPKAHATPSAPSQVSSILSGLFVKSGVYMLIRLVSLFSVRLDMGFIFVILGVFTAVAGAVFAFSQTDIKLLLSYHTISQVGLIVLAFSLGTKYAYYGALMHIFTHGIFKALLIMAADAAVSHFETRNIKKMYGIWYSNKTLAILFLVGILGITGSPFMNGGFSKALIGKDMHVGLLEPLYVIITMLTMISFSKFFPFLFAKRGEIRPLKLRIEKLISLSSYAIIVVVTGVFGPVFLRFLMNSEVGYAVHYPPSKFVIYTVEFIISYFLFTLLYKKQELLNRIKSIELDFNNIILTMCVFFVVTLVYLEYIN